MYEREYMSDMRLANHAPGTGYRNEIIASGIGVLFIAVVLGALGTLVGCASPSGTASGRPADPDPVHTWTRSSLEHEI